MRHVMLLTTASAILAFSAGPVLARGEGGGGREGGGGGGEIHAGGGEGVHVAEPNAQVHVVPNAGVSGNGGHRFVAPRETPREGERSEYAGANGWRYRYNNGAWWYWLPANRWMYYDNGAWQDYAADNAAYDNSTVTLDVPSDPNYYWYNNAWWYLMPGNRWSYYEGGRWRDGAPGMGPQRRETGYRGIPENRENRPSLNNTEPRGPNGIEGNREVRPATPETHGPVNTAPRGEGPVGPRK